MALGFNKKNAELVAWSREGGNAIPVRSSVWPERRVRGRARQSKRGPEVGLELVVGLACWCRGPLGMSERGNPSRINLEEVIKGGARSAQLGVQGTTMASHPLLKSQL